MLNINLKFYQKVNSNSKNQNQNLSYDDNYNSYNISIYNQQH